MGDKDPYAVLQIKRTADVTEIRKSYQRLARQVCVRPLLIHEFFEYRKKKFLVKKVDRFDVTTSLINVLF